MPKAGGLPDVEQKFTGDSTGDVRASDEIVEAAIRTAKENREVLKVWDDMKVSVKGLQVNIAEIRSNLQKFIAVQRDVINVQKEINESFEGVSGLVKAN